MYFFIFFISLHYKNEIKIMGKDWIGTSESVFKNIAGVGHSKCEREEHDYYATSPIATKLLMQLETFDKNIWEPACGEKHITKVLESHGYNVFSSDIINRTGDIKTLDFLQSNIKWDGDIITNPPYKYAHEFVEKALDCISDGHKIAMFLKIQFLEGKKRKQFFIENPPKRIWVSSSRLSCAMNGNWDDKENECSESAVCYCWFIWEKGYKGDTVIKWFN